MLFFLGCDKKKIQICWMNNMLLYVCLNYEYGLCMGRNHMQ